MIRNSSVLSTISTIAASALFLVGCSDNSYIAPPPSDAKTLTVSITDAPLDGVSKVIVQFAGIEIKHEDSEAQIIEFAAPVEVDLHGLQGDIRSTIMLEEKVPSGDYQYIRLLVNAALGEFDSVVLLEDNTWQSLYIPDDAKIGLKLNQAFYINSSKNTHLTIDFDLRKSLEKDVAEDDYQLIPSLRVVSDVEAGHVAGLVENQLLIDNGCVGVDNQTNAAVYLYNELAEGASPQDIQRNELDPVSSANVEFNTDTGEYFYTLGFLPRDVPYSAQVVCDASIDLPSAVDALSFIGPIQSVIPVETLTVNLDFASP